MPRKGRMLLKKNMNVLYQQNSSSTNYLYTILIICLIIIIGINLGYEYVKSLSTEIKYNTDTINFVYVNYGIVILFGIILTISVLKNPYKYKTCNNFITIIILYIFIILFIIVFIYLSFSFAYVLFIIYRLGWNYPILEFYQNDNIILTVYAWIIFDILLFSILTVTLFIYLLYSHYNINKYNCRI